ncbi:MAG: D-sedoheptulose 7-phosphate isomerase [Alphaproteobacteria bacterium]|jgi:D-sedoheptulose 7-phosphate isomerase|nr:D-sedoheptulose 7-phosphate isomerase [Alphaproteobacteria bacterium]MBP9878343.1 D-sedoheptulose 7-phosphate isomerase [Alphaproteobacteria bacterium]
MNNMIKSELHKSRDVLDRMIDSQDLLIAIEQVIQKSISALKSGQKLIFAGNGGSASDAQHLAAELVGRYQKEREALPALALTTDTSALTAISNDYGFEQVFARQLAALGQKGDLYFALSTSGNSKNILASLHIARKKGLICVGMTGENGGAMNEHCDYMIKVPSSITAKIQEGHIKIGHILCLAIEEAF